jgi:hypothetical protein
MNELGQTARWTASLEDRRGAMLKLLNWEHLFTPFEDKVITFYINTISQ